MHVFIFLNSILIWLADISTIYAYTLCHIRIIIISRRKVYWAQNTSATLKKEVNKIVSFTLTEKPKLIHVTTLRVLPNLIFQLSIKSSSLHSVYRYRTVHTDKFINFLPLFKQSLTFIL